MSHTKSKNKECPSWLTKLTHEGYMPYIATSEHLLPYLNVKPFGLTPHIFIMETEDHTAFHEAYLLANSLSFKSPDLKMPNWVLIDCVLLQTAVVGFVKLVASLPESFLTHFRNDPCVDLDQLKYLPISGQISSPATGNHHLIGISLFSLARDIGGGTDLGLYTKALAFEVFQAAHYDFFLGIAQYNNPALKIHGRFSQNMEIYQSMVPLHPKKDMTFIYKMKIDYDPYSLDVMPNQHYEPTFLMNASDISGKKRIEKGMRDGKRYTILPPYSQKKDGEIYLPIHEEKQP